ncbi:sigma-70 family RNA polymerase sigma factor [Psychromarinibacter sp. C21-152]|uniref:RNA polymerase sigma factor n=1 Tax=Psychromarinibacter sediminicola TaxID=3033385 RepID=A0AAE3TAF7_9RHOB|nr:sigma-70 family RNA polymerase sigma factor [Psychromarinibacter sediminicola]MDF0601570.1 sigma-70 family RNA polymerase sigma factor [Psychromarinibacter sediminicola]
MTVRDDIVDLIPALRAYAWALTRRHEDVDDLVQDTLLKAIAKIDSYQPGTNLRAWLITIMRNTFRNDIARSKRSRTGEEDCVSTTLTTPATQEWTVRGGEMMQAVARLPLHYREMLITVVMLGESYESAAEIFGVRIGTVKSRVNRARAMVAEDLQARAPNDPLGAAAEDGASAAGTG